MSIFSSIAKGFKKSLDVIFPGASQAGEAAASEILPQPPAFPEFPAPPAPPGSPGEDPAARAAREAAAEELRRRSGRGRSSTNPLGGLGDTSTPNLAAKSLLGF